MSTNNAILDLLVIGTSHEGVYNMFIAKFPTLNAMYIHAKSDLIKEVFTTRKPKRTLIYGDLTKKNVMKSNPLGELNFELLTILFGLKELGQKILVAGYYGINHPNFLKMPVSPEKIMQKFDEIEEGSIMDTYNKFPIPMEHSEKAKHLVKLVLESKSKSDLSLLMDTHLPLGNAGIFSVAESLIDAPKGTPLAEKLQYKFFLRVCIYYLERGRSKEYDDGRENLIQSIIKEVYTL